MITTTLGQLVAADKAFDRLGARALPAKVAYTTAKFLKLVRAELAEYQALHNNLVRQYGEPVGNDGSYRVRPEQWECFRAALTDILATPVEINGDPLRLDALGDDPFRADDLVALDPFITNGAAPPTRPT